MTRYSAASITKALKVLAILSLSEGVDVERIDRKSFAWSVHLRTKTDAHVEVSVVPGWIGANEDGETIFGDFTVTPGICVAGDAECDEAIALWPGLQSLCVAIREALT